MVLSVFGAGTRRVAGAATLCAAGLDDGPGGSQGGTPRPPFAGDAA